LVDVEKIKDSDPRTKEPGVSLRESMYHKWRTDLTTSSSRKEYCDFQDILHRACICIAPHSIFQPVIDHPHLRISYLLTVEFVSIFLFRRAKDNIFSRRDPRLDDDESSFIQGPLAIKLTSWWH
jgi:hypothetical protein